ncbi:MAG: OmpA family protein [Bacteroidetes bacterium]|nr:OmpA family protein [Bacteroidota bacterium]
MCNYLFRIILLMFILYRANAEISSYTIKSKKYISLYKESKKYLHKKKFKIAEEKLLNIVRRKTNFLEAKITLARLYISIGKLDKCIFLLNNVSNSLPKKGFYYLNYDVAYICYRCGQYNKSKAILNQIDNLKLSKKYKNKIKVLKFNLEYSLKLIKSPINFHPKQMPNPLNKFAAQYFPVLSIDQNTILFTGRANYKISADESIYMSKKNKKGIWLEPKLISKNINTINNEGACTLSSDGNILIFSAYNRKENFGSCDLYISYKRSNQWTKPKNLGPNINSKGWQSQPSLTADGKTLYFASKRKGNIGKKDIWKSIKTKDGKWSKAINLGKQINSKGNEISPFIHPNGKTLYFASDRIPLLGGLDLYYSEFINGEWTKPKNLGYPINNHKDQVSLFITADGKKGYFAAGTQKGIHYNGKLFEFDIPDKIIPKPSCIFFKGIINAEDENDNLEAKIFVYDIDKKQFSFEYDITLNGNFCLPLNDDASYSLYISKKNYLVKKIDIDLKEISTKGIYKTINLKTFKSGSEYEIKNILFAFDSYDIDDRDKLEFQSLVILLKENLNIKILIKGYTDDIGSNIYNMNLSEKRAKAIYDFLIQSGISKLRLQYKGYGKVQNTNSNEQVRRNNRRVSFQIIK